jgi:hypothetical protein
VTFVSLLDLPGYNDYSLSLRETRIVYLHGELRLDKRELELTEQGFSVEQIARELFALRNGLRTWTRNLMSDRRAAEVLESGNPNATWDELVAICRDEGFTGEGIFREIIEKAKRSRAKINAALGLDPKNPPPLPPVRPSAPRYDGPHWTAD